MAFAAGPSSKPFDFVVPVSPPYAAPLTPPPAQILVNRAKMSVATAAGTDNIQLSAAVTGYQAFADAGIINGNLISYVIEDGINWEIGKGTYIASNTTLIRTTVIASSAGGTSKINATSAAQVYCTALASDFSPISTPAAFGAVGDGVTNDTIAVNNFLASIRDGGYGSWGNKTYLVDEGVLLLQPTSTAGDTIAPTIINRAKFIASGRSDAPILTVKNPDRISASAFYRYGDLGQIEFVDNTGSGSNRHGLELSGVFSCRGQITGTTLQGAVIHIPLRTLPYDADSYEVFGCDFKLTNRQSIYGVLNDNTVDGSISLSYFLNSSSGSHGYKTAGSQQTKISQISVGTQAGYGLNFATGGGTGNRLFVDGGEMDVCQLGAVFIDSMQGFDIKRIRIQMRNEANTGNVTWPVNGCIVIGNVGLVSNGYIDFICRVNPGVTLGNITPMLDCSNSIQITDLTVKMTIVDQTTGTVLPTDAISLGNLLVKNIHDNVSIDVFVNGEQYINQLTNKVFEKFIADKGITAVVNTDFTLSLPPRQTITDIQVFTKTAFGAATDAKIQVGSSTGAADFCAATSIKAIGTYLLPITPSNGTFYTAQVVPNLFFRIVQTGTASAVGLCTIVVKYAYTAA